MTRDTVMTDETGLHSIDCECVRCDAGYKPTPGEREVARRALAHRLAAAARAAAGEEPPPVRHYLRGYPPIRKPTPEEWAELEQLRKGIGK